MTTQHTQPAPGAQAAPTVQAYSTSRDDAAANRIPQVLRSADLLGTHQTVLIEHQGQHYRLQATRQGKLILTK